MDHTSVRNHDDGVADMTLGNDIETPDRALIQLLGAFAVRDDMVRIACLITLPGIGKTLRNVGPWDSLKHTKMPLAQAGILPDLVAG